MKSVSKDIENDSKVIDSLVEGESSKKDEHTDMALDSVKEKLDTLMALIKHDNERYKNFENDEELKKNWESKARDAKYFNSTIATELQYFNIKTDISILLVLIILVIATVIDNFFPFVEIGSFENIFLIFLFLIIATVIIPIYHHIRLSKITHFLMGDYSRNKGRINVLRDKFIEEYNRFQKGLDDKLIKAAYSDYKPIIQKKAKG